MSTEKVEINEAVAQKSTEEQVKELKEQGIDVNTLQSEDGTTIVATEPDTQAQNIENQRPEWLPEKFKNAEDLAKAYSELEKQFSSKKDEPVKEEASEDLTIPKEEVKSSPCWSTMVTTDSNSSARRLVVPLSLPGCSDMIDMDGWSV